MAECTKDETAHFMLCKLWLLQCPLLTGIPLLLQVSSLFPQHKPCHNCRGPDTPPWTSPLTGHPSLWSVWSGGIIQTWRQPSCQTSCRPIWCHHWPLMCRGALPAGVCVPPPARGLGGLHIPISCRRQGWRADEGTGVTVLLQDFGEVALFLLQVVLPGGDAPCSIIETPDQSPLDMEWTVFRY